MSLALISLSCVVTDQTAASLSNVEAENRAVEICGIHYFRHPGTSTKLALRILDTFAIGQPRENMRIESRRLSNSPLRLLHFLCVRKLIVNADDFGLTAGVNRGIVEAHNSGVVSSATLMASGPAFADAVTAARSAPNLSVGCHVVLVDGTPVLPPDAVDTLRAIRSAEPNRFYSSLSAFAARAMLGGFDRDQLVAEVVAQIKKLQSAGIQVTHLDSHKHAHVFPEILAALLRAARICGVRAIRNPIVPVKAISAHIFKDKRELWKRYGQVRVLHTFSRQFHQRTKRAGLLTPDGVVGVIETGTRENPEGGSAGGSDVKSGYSSLLRATLSNLPEGTWEFVCHPGYNDDDLRATGTRLLASRDEERRLLTAVALRQFLDEQKIRVIGYREFCAS